jgi:predicted MFS family arabinose efflux permease
VYRAAEMRELFRIPEFALVWLVGLFQGVGVFLLVNVPGHFLELGISEGGIGLIYAGSALAGFTVRPAIGRALDVVRRRTVIRVGGVIQVTAILGLALTAAAGPQMFAFFVVARAAQIMVFTGTLTYVADTLPPELRTRGLAVFGLSGLLPIALSSLGGDPIIALAGYRGAIAASAVLGFVAWLLVWRLPPLPVMGQQPRRSFWTTLAQPDLRMVWFITFVFAMGIESVFAFIRTFVDTHPHVGSLGLFFGIYGGVAIVARLFGSRVFERFHPRRVAAGGAMALGAGMLLLAVATVPLVFVAAAAMTGAAHGLVFPVLNSQVVERARSSERGSAMTTFTSVFDIALLGFIPVVGLLIDLSGYTAAFAAVAVAIVAGAIGYVRWDTHRSAGGAERVDVATVE